MKTKLFLLALIILPFFTSCKKSSDEELKFTKLTVEQQKQKIEDNGISFLNNIQKIEDTDVFAVIQNFMNLANSSSSGELAPIANYLNKSVILKTKVPIQKTVFPQSDWGKWVWNFNTNNFTKTETYTSEKVIFLFPSTESGATNNAEFTFILVNSNVMSPDTINYYPSSITSTLKVNGTTYMTQNFTATFSNGYPSSTTEEFTIDKFMFNSTASHSDKKVSSGMSFKYDKTNLMSYEFNTEGKFDDATLNGIKDMPTDAISNTKFKYTVMNIGFLGVVSDFQGFMDEGNAAGDNVSLTQQAEIMNKYFKVFAYFVDDNRKFAVMEFFPDTRTYTESQYDYVYNNQTGQYEYVLNTHTITEDYLGVRFVMNDGSKVKAEDYIQQGFEDLQAKLEEILGSYQE